METSAIVTDSPAGHDVQVSTGGAPRSLAIPAKPGGKGSAVNGGELLMLALATCYSNDLFREAERLRIPLESVRVEATADFPGVGLAAAGIRYTARVTSPVSPAEIAGLLRRTDAIAEVHNTVRAGVPVELITGNTQP